MGMGLGPESERSLYLGLVRTIPGLFVLIAPLIGGAIVEVVNYPVMFLVALVLGLVGVRNATRRQNSTRRKRELTKNNDSFA